MAFPQPPSDSDEFIPPYVDCTLSLGTPSTRRSSPSSPVRPSTGTSHLEFSNLILESKLSISNNHIFAPPNYGGSGVNPPSTGRRCAICGTTSTPLWRKGPRGPKTLCNACGIRFQKVERRAKAEGDTVEGGKGTEPEGGGASSRRRPKSPAGSGILESSSIVDRPPPSSPTSPID